MNRLFKRTLAIAATAPMAFIATVGPAGAGTTNQDPTPTVSQSGPGYIIDCEHPTQPQLDLRITLWTEGDDDGDEDDIDRAMVEADDEDFYPGNVFLQDNINVRSIKLEFFSDNVDEFNDEPRRIYRDTEHVRRGADGREFFRVNRDDVGFVRATVKWRGPTNNDDDGESLNCLAPLDGSEFP